MELPGIAYYDPLHSQQKPSRYCHMLSLATFLLGFPCVKVIGSRCDGEQSKSNKTYPSRSGDLGLEHSRGANHSGLHFGFKFIWLAKSVHCNKILLRASVASAFYDADWIAPNQISSHWGLSPINYGYSWETYVDF
jgi:hypothetical protein